MVTVLAVVIGQLAVPALTATRLQAPPPALTVSTARFYAPRSGSTTIEGVVEVDLATVFASARQATRYRFEVQVSDSTGLDLLRSQWSREVPITARRGATTVESFSFAAAPGRYRVRVRVTPEGGGAVERETEVVAYGQRPLASDLVLATAVRRPASDSEVPAPGEMRRAGLIMRTAPVPRLVPTEASLSYYAELYPSRTGTVSGDMRAQVIAVGGRTVIETPAREVRVDSAGALTRGTLDLTGLPEGAYQLRLRLRLGDTTVTAEAPFAMAGLGTLVDTRPAAAADLFEVADDAQLDSLYGPLVLLIEARGEQGVYGLLTLNGKRNFLREFWRRRDPTPGDADNPAMNEFYRAVRFVNETFRESGRGNIPGWRTDRGRIYLRNGVWDNILQRPAGSPRPYEVWRYERDRQRYYVFFDQSGLGNYVLLGTNDRREGGRPNWLSVLGAEAAEDVRRFLNIQDLDSIDR